jgi:hypothetical protein
LKQGKIERVHGWGVMGYDVTVKFPDGSTMRTIICDRGKPPNIGEQVTVETEDGK